VFSVLFACLMAAGVPGQTVERLGPTTVEIRLDAGAEPEGPSVLGMLLPVIDGVRPRASLVGAGSGAGVMVEFGAEAVAGGVEVVPAFVAGAAANELRRARVRVEYPAKPPAADRLNAMGRMILAAAGLDAGTAGEAEGYLVIVPDEFYSNVAPLAAWRERQGFRVWVKQTSETGSTKEQIRSYIQTAYSTWSPTPSYVVLVGAVNKMPAFVNPGTPCVTDHPYATVDGSDFLADLFVGRLPAANSSELDVMVAKIVGYESNPAVADTTWFHRALMVGTSYQEGGTPAVTALRTKRHIRERMLGFGFTQIDTVFYPPTASGRGLVDTAVNRGVSFINGRGWGNYEGWRYPQFLINDVAGLQNGWRLPVVTSIYCGTGNYQANPCFGELWLRAGSPTSPRGGVAFWGSSYTGTSTRWNNCMDYGIYEAIFNHGQTVCGPAMYSGKLAQYSSFPLPGDSVELRNYFHVYNLLGDPALSMWTAVPRGLNVSHPGWVPAGTSSFDVYVTDGHDAPVAGALVCVSKSGEVHEVGRTDAWGACRLSTPSISDGNLLVTVTGSNLVPYLGQVGVGAADVWVGQGGFSPATAGPGQAVDLNVTLRNFGSSQTATGVTATVRALSGAVVTDSVRSYADIGPGGTASAAPFSLTVAPSCTSGQRIELQVSVTSGQGTWQSALSLRAQGPTLRWTRSTIHDGNGWLDPGETAELSVSLWNRGGGAANGLTATLRSLSPNAVEVVDSTGSFGSIGAGDSAMNSSDRFTVRANAAVGTGRRFSLRLVMRTTDGGEFEWDFPVTVGAPAGTAPFGPDRHGYYAYDDTDAGYPERPSYDWVEIDPNHGGGGTRVAVGSDNCVAVSLPFTFRFYGREFSSISISDNGFVAPGTQWVSDAYNWRLPSPEGTDGVIAAFWDDFRDDTLGASGIYTWHDAANHRFVVEWSRCVHAHGYRPPYYGEQQTFEMILHDPAHHPTPTGDGPILFQYHTVFNDDTLFENNHNYATIGVSSPDNSDGLEYTYAGAYPAACAPAAPGRAIKLTTVAPDTFVAVAERGQPAARRPVLSILPSPSRGAVTISFAAAGDGAGPVSLFDATGRRVRTLVGPAAGAGPGVWRWDLRDDAGRAVPAGVYEAVLTAGTAGTTIVRGRMLIVR
jgi:hypothetical protein